MNKEHFFDASARQLKKDAQTLCVNTIDSQNVSTNHVNIIALVTRSYFCSFAQNLCVAKRYAQAAHRVCIVQRVTFQMPPLRHAQTLCVTFSYSQNQ
ncbi:hypothetical protein SODG_003803 [Sodalis praecaptivus]